MTTKKVVLIVVASICGVALVVALVAGAIVGFVFYTLDHSEASQTAKTFLRQNETLRRDIGAVRDFGYFTTGNINAQGSMGNAELHLKTIGERKTVNATILLAYRSGHEWRIVDAFYDDAAGQRIYLTKNFDDNTEPASPGDATAPGDQNSPDDNRNTNERRHRR
jgi:hypothetical protein